MSWTRRLDGRAADVLAVADRAERLDGVAPLSGHVLDGIGVGADDYLLLPSEGDGEGDVAGVAVAHAADPVELVVDPAFRRRGLGRVLLTRALDRSGAVWAHGDLPAARTLAAAAGLVPSRTLLQMRRSVDPAWAAGEVAAAPLPAGVRVRTFVPGHDEEQFLGVNARAFAWHPEQGRLDRAGLELEMAQPWFDPSGFFLAVDADDTVLGFHWTKVHTPDLTVADRPGTDADTGRPEPLGEVYVLGVDPAGRLAGEPVRGLGAPLTAIGLRHLASQGIATVLLYVEGDNDRALALYRRLGFTVFSADVVYRRPD